MASAAAGGFVAKMSARRQLLAGIVLAFSNFMVVLDLTIANVSVPNIAADLGITLEQGAWVITSYAVAEAICVPLTGWLALRYGTVRVFTLAMLGFGFFSLLCGLSPTLGMLVACRIGQGLCGAPIMPASQALLLTVFPPERRAAAMAAWAMTTLLGPAMGPIIGGYISDVYSWHWIFLINVPIAAVCVIAGTVLLRPVETETRKQPIDVVGLLLLVFWIGSLQIMLDIGREHDWFADPTIVMLAVCAAVGLAAFVIWELTDDHPVVDLRIFRHKGFTSAVLTLALCFGAYFASIVVIPQWMQTTLGYSASTAGLSTALAAMAALTTAPLVPRVMGKVDSRLMISMGVAWLGIMSLVRSGWTSGADFWSLSWPQLIQGFAMPFFFMPLTQLSLSSVEPDEIASAAGMQSFLRTMAVAVSTSVVLTYWGNQQRVAQNAIADTLQPEAASAALAQAGMSSDQARQVIGNIAGQEAVTVALDQTFVMAAILLFVAAALIWIAPRPGPSVEPGAGGH